MIVLPWVLGLIASVLVNGLADNLVREEDMPLSTLFLPRCAYCDAPRKFRDWSAVFSTLFQSGRCLRCGAPRRFRDLLTEGILWAGWPAVWLAAKGDLHGMLIGGWILSTFLLFAVIDFETRFVVVETVALAALVLLLDGWIQGNGTLIRMLTGGAAGFAVFLLFFFLGRLLAALLRLGQGVEPLGFGDVILAALVGLVTGWPAILLALFVSVFLGGIVGLGVLAASLFKKNPVEHATMAYGPYLLAAGLLMYFYGGQFLGGLIDVFQDF
jgi:leader peptidase (prepilin peptidase)/N-methyltransferase